MVEFLRLESNKTPFGKSGDLVEVVKWVDTDCYDISGLKYEVVLCKNSKGDKEELLILRNKESNRCKARIKRFFDKLKSAKNPDIKASYRTEIDFLRQTFSFVATPRT